MNRYFAGRYVVIFLVLMLCTGMGAQAIAREAEVAEKVPQLLRVGDVGNDAIGIKIWTAKPENVPYRPNDPIIIHLKAETKAYVTAIYVSSMGDAMVLFPNKESTTNEVVPGKEYTLFGEGSNIQIKATEKTKKARIVFYVTSQPVDLAPLKILEGQPCIVIPRQSTAEMEVLTKKLETMAKQKGFNRVVLGLKTGAREEEGLKLMGLPVGVKTTRPESITGVQGLQEKVKIPKE